MSVSAHTLQLHTGCQYQLTFPAALYHGTSELTALHEKNVTVYAKMNARILLRCNEIGEK